MPDKPMEMNNLAMSERAKPLLATAIEHKRENVETISHGKIEIEFMRLLVLKAAKAMDVLGNKEARIWVSMIKAKAPEQVCDILGQAMQVHGATSILQCPPLSGMYCDNEQQRL